MSRRPYYLTVINHCDHRNVDFCPILFDIRVEPILILIDPRHLHLGYCHDCGDKTDNGKVNLVINRLLCGDFISKTCFWIKCTRFHPRQLMAFSHLSSEDAHRVEPYKND